MIEAAIGDQVWGRKGKIGGKDGVGKLRCTLLLRDARVRMGRVGASRNADLVLDIYRTIAAQMANDTSLLYSAREHGCVIVASTGSAIMFV